MIPITTYIFKTTAFCNLNCTYCYIFNLADQSFKGRPKIMPLDIVERAAARMVEQANLQGIRQINVAFHGGEPLLAGREWLRRVVEIFRQKGGEEVQFVFSLQTNGVLLDAEWVDLFDRLQIGISVSLDGPKEINDKTRVNFSGRGSYDDVARGLRHLVETPAGQRVFGGVLCVVDPAADGLEIYRHFRSLGIKAMDFLLPLEHNWDNPPSGHQDPRVTPYADYLIPIFDEWWAEDNPAIRIRYFETILGHFFDGNAGVDSLGGHPISFGIVDTDGSLEPLDSLRVCGDGFCDMGLNVMKDPIASLYDETLFQVGLLGQDGLCEICQACPLHEVCGAGYLPHRYSQENGLRNQSVYCRDLWKLINHVLDAALARASLNPAVASPIGLQAPGVSAAAGETTG
jgi:uncharacterized protein